jgi:hypothetical protein
MTEVSKVSRDLALTEAQRQENASARLELTKALDEMVQAINSNRTLQTQAGKLKDKGRFAAIVGALSGANDRDLATMVKELGGSLETTQKAVQVVLRLQSRKDHVLREFHSVLLEKIQMMQADTHTLDANQQAAVDVLCDFQEQIEDQLRHHEAVERHEQEIAELNGKLTRKENELRQGLQALDGQTLSLKSASDHLAGEVDTLAKELSAHALLSAKELKLLTESQQALNDDLMSLKGKCAGEITALQSAGQGMMELVDGLRKQYASATDLLSKRLEHLSEAEADLMRRTKLVETQLADQSSLPGWMKRNAVALIGLVIGALALVQVAVR